VTETTTPTPVAASQDRSLPARIVGVIFSPRATYAAVAARPQWFGVLALVALVAAGGAFALLSTEVGQQAWIDAAVRQQEAFGRTLTDQQYDRLQQMAKFAPYFGAVSLVALPIVAAVVSALLLGVFNAIAGGDASFKQVLAIVSHSAVILPVTQIIAAPIAYARETLSGVTNVMVFFPFIDENSFAARFLGSIDLVYIWWIVSVSIGLGVLYKRRTGPIATTLFFVYAAIALVIAAIRTAAAGA
jgi:Yip1-like protein